MSTARQKGDLPYVLPVLEEFDKDLDDHENRIVKLESRVLTLEQKMALVDQFEKHLDDRITALQDGVREEFRRLRLGLGVR